MIEFVVGDALQGLHEAKKNKYRFDSAVFSPPYNMSVGYDVCKDSLPREAYLGHCQIMARHLFEVAHEGSVVWLQMGPNAVDFSLPYAVLERYAAEGWLLCNQIAWIKSGTFPQKDGSEASFGHYRPMNSPIYLHRAWEWVFMLVLDKKSTVQLDKLALGVQYEDLSNLKRWGKTENKRCRGNCWFVPHKTTQKSAHPCTFPVELVENCLKLQGLDKISCVLDPYCGTGATAEAAARHGKSFLGFDLSENYINEAIKRPLGGKASVRRL